MCKLKVGFLVIFISLFSTTGKSSQNVTQVKYCNIKICLNISIKKYCTNGKRRNIKYNARTCTVHHQNVHQQQENYCELTAKFNEILIAIGCNI